MGLISKPIFPRLAKRFQVRQGSSEQLETGLVLVPITDADRLLRAGKISTTTSEAQSRTDTYTVPSGKRWTLQNVYIFRDDQASGAPYDTIAIIDTNGNTATVANQQFSGVESMNNLTGTPSSPIILESGWQIVITFSTSGVTSTITSSIVYEEEDTF